MLEDKNIYRDAYTRSSCMIAFDSELLSRHHPVDWVINLNLQRNHDVLLERFTDRLSIRDQDVL